MGLSLFSPQIEIEPRNHFAPSFSSLIYEVGCPENAPDGHLIAKLNAVDPDRSIFGQVKYYIAQCDEPDLFEIDEDSGEVTLHAGNGDISLDREVKGSHTLEIVARDGGGWLGYTKLAVKVIDTNECKIHIIIIILIYITKMRLCHFRAMLSISNFRHNFCTPGGLHNPIYSENLLLSLPLQSVNDTHTEARLAM